MRSVKAAAVQLSPVLYSREGTVDKVVRKIHELGREGVQFATFPETVVPYYPYFSFVQPAYQIVGGREHLKLLDQAVTVPSAATNAISDACKEAGVVVSIGINERDGGTLYNTQLLFRGQKCDDNEWKRTQEKRDRSCGNTHLTLGQNRQSVEDQEAVEPRRRLVRKGRYPRGMSSRNATAALVITRATLRRQA